MDPKFLEARDHVLKAREALHRGDKASAWKLGEQAALLVPDMEDAWLVLAASESDPDDALAYAQKALEINPSSTRAHKAVEWTLARTTQAPAPKITVEPVAEPIADLRTYASIASITPETMIGAPAYPRPEKTPPSNHRSLIFAGAIFVFLICAVAAFAAYSAVTRPALASILNGAAIPTQENLWASVKIAKPSITSNDGNALAQQVLDTPAPVETKSSLPGAAKAPTSASTEEPRATEVPTEAMTPTPNVTDKVTETPGSMVMEVVVDTPTSVIPTSSAPLPAVASSGNGTRWIDVDLTNQRVYAYEGDVVVNAFIVSTGTWLTPTVTGQYNIYVKYRSTKMSGPGYYLPDVPYVMYFYKGYGLHGTYWHNNFGTPMSHGCVNLRTDEAAWLFDWASVGTLVNVHY
jgi:lipoprotein-anchoring transpeptidase ErfK/SrfK